MTLYLSFLPKGLSDHISSTLSKKSNMLMDFSRDGNKKPRMSMCLKELMPEWAQVLEPVRNLPTDGGSQILKCISEALNKNPPKFAKTILEHAISKRVYKANASELTKNMVIILLAHAFVENNPGKRKVEMVKAKTNVLRIEEPKPTMIEEPQEMMIDEEFKQLIYEANESLSKEVESVSWSRMMEMVSSDPPVSTSVEEDFNNNIPEWAHVLENNPANWAHPEVESTGPSTELDLLKAQERALQEEIASFNDKKDEMIRSAKKEAVEAYKTSDEFHQDFISAITQSWGPPKS